MRGIFILIRAMALQLGGTAKEVAEQLPESEQLTDDYQADILLVEQEEMLAQADDLNRARDNLYAGVSPSDLDSRAF